MVFNKAKWIWNDNNSVLSDRCVFRHKFYLDKIPSRVILNIAAETKYYLYINDKLAVFDGGLFRESTKGNGYYDVADIKEYLNLGENTISILVWFFKNAGRNNVDSGRAGLIFESPQLDLYSSSAVKVYRDDAYYNTERRNPSYLYGGHNIGYNANKSVGNYFSKDFNDSFFKEAREFGDYLQEPWNECVQRPIPLFKFYDIKTTEYKSCGSEHTVDLPCAMHFTPYIKVKASGGEVIDICSDRYRVNGGPGDNINVYSGHRAEYICRAGEQEFEFLNWLFGEKIIFNIPLDVEIIELGFRESCYDCKVKNIITEDEKLNKLLEKCVRTLKVCMRENFMDCPDRERGQWIGDVSVQAPQVFYAMDKNAVLLLKKAILDFINLRKGDILVGNVPGIHSSELPAQSLNAISEYGMISEYYKNTKDLDILKICFEPCVSYLKLWDVCEDGFISKRSGDWYWFDHLFNIDERVLENAWYFSALKFAETMQNLLKDYSHSQFLSERINSIKANFDAAFWTGTAYSSGKELDDRANALAVLSGLADKQKYDKIKDILISVFNSTPYMEYYVLEALCIMGYRDLAFDRMMQRYKNLIDNENTTLWEDFNILGTKNHAWSGGPLTIVCKYFPELIIEK